MKKKGSEISEEMYHRLYRLAKRQVDPRLIAAALRIPLRTVQSVLDRMQHSGEEYDQLTGVSSDTNEKGFLDTYFYTKITYAVLQFVGELNEKTFEIFENELKKIEDSTWKAVVIRLTDVTYLDKKSGEKLLDFTKKMETQGKYIALLDPAPELDPFLKEYGIEDAIQIFGTERAFEDKVVSHRSATGLWKIRS